MIRHAGAFRGCLPGRGRALSLLFFALVLLAVPPSSAEDGKNGDAVLRGRTLYLEHCARCHGPSARGDGPDRRLFEVPAADLVGSRTLERNSDEALTQWVLAGQRYQLDRGEAKDVAEERPGTASVARFLRRLPAVDWPRADAGKRIYLSRCARCHGWYGRPTDEPAGAAHDLGDPRFQGSVTDRELAALARHVGPGRPALDPPLGDAEAADVVSFLRLLSPGYELYQRYCVNCHGPHGRTAWLAFDDAYFRKLAPGDLEEQAWHMLRTAEPSMPHFEGMLSKHEVASILRYLRTLPANPPRGR